MVSKQMRAAVVGASTLLGKELIEELNNSPAGAWDIRLLDESEEGESQLMSAGDEAVLVQPLTAEALEGVDLVFFAGEPAVAREYRSAAGRAGAAIIDLTGALEGEPGMLVRSPWIGGGTKPDLTTAGVVPAHPAALMLAVVVDRLRHRFGLKALTATVLEPASQAGRAAVDELHQQTVSLLSFQSLPKEIFDTQVAFNVQSALGESSRVELRLVADRIRRHLEDLLGPESARAVRFQAVQAPVFHGYTISGLVDLETGTSADSIRDVLNGGVVQAEPDTAPSNLAASESGDLLLSLQRDSTDTTGALHWVWMAADNLRLAARNAVAAALELAALRPAGGVQ